MAILAMEQERERLSKKEVKAEVNSDQVDKLGNNTFKIVYPDGREAIRYHHTDVITRLPNGDIVLNTGGWKTPTTKERMGHLSDYAPGFQIFQEKSIWYLRKGAWYDKDAPTWTFEDGMVIHPDGTVEGGGPDPRASRKLIRQCAEYSKAYIEKLLARELPAPSGADCWYCCLREDKGYKRSLGEMTNNQEHILNHFEEKYYVPSLLMNAIRLFPVSQVAMGEIGYAFKLHEQSLGEWGKDIAKSQVQKSIYRFLKRQLGLAS